MDSLDGLALSELQYLHVLVSVKDHAAVTRPLEPGWDQGDQVTAKQLGCQGVEGRGGYADLEI